MNSIKLWIAILAIVSFAAGAGTGVWITARSLKSEAPAGAFGDYEELLARRFALSPERRKCLNAVLEAYRRDVDGIKDRYAAESMSAMEPELRERGQYYRTMVQERVVPAAQRAEFERLAQLLPSNR